MPITIAEDNHIGIECVKVSKQDLKLIDKKWLMWHTVEEWRESVESSMYQDHDCDGTWCCEHDGEKYSSSIRVYAADAQDSSSIPNWATHVLWSSK